MKNSAETKADSNGTGSNKSVSGKTGFSLFSIDEHRLSLGLLALLLLSGAGYGIWLLMAPYLPESTGTKNVSRKALAEAHSKSEEWNEAIPLYREMLKDDPENGFAIQELAMIRENQLREKWRELGQVGATTGNSRASKELLDAEAQLFESAIRRWRDLRDHARYQRRAYEHLAYLHSYRSNEIGSAEEVDKAIDVLKEMLDNGLTIANGIDNMQPFRFLKDHPEFKRLVREEKRHSNFR